MPPRRLDLTGQRYGRLLVLEPAGSDQQGRSTSRVRCDCGGELVVPNGRLREGRLRSCGCLRREINRHGLDLTGQRFGLLVVLAEAGTDQHGKRLWHCRCDCGRETVLPTGRLRNGSTRSCGCQQGKAR